MKPEYIVERVLALRQELLNDGRYGPFVVKIPDMVDLNQLYYQGTNLTTNLEDRILGINHIEKVVSYTGNDIEVCCNE